MKNLSAVILAAGEGTRMSSDYPKILHKLGSKPMLGHVLETVNCLEIRNIFVITGYKSELVEKYVGDKAKCIQQKKLLGTADAVWQIKDEPSLNKKDTHLLVIYGDTPLITNSTLERLIKKHFDDNADCTFLTAKLKDPTSYGRILRNESGRIVKIVEEQEADVFQKAIEEVNVGVYVFKVNVLFESIKLIKPENKKKEYYLTDAIETLHKKGLKIAFVETQDYNEIVGVNSRIGMANAYEVLRLRIIKQTIAAGVTVLDPKTTFIDEKVNIGKDTVIYPFTIIERNVDIGKNCEIGPFCRIRSGCRIADDVSIGNFVEINRTQVGKKTRLKHQTYIGDTIIGEGVNIGAGTIVANFDGKNKHQTIIESRAFIGTGTILVAPVKIGKSAITGAGSVVTKNKDVPDRTIVVGVPAKILRKNKG